LTKGQRLKGQSQICFVAIFGFYEQVGIGSADGFSHARILLEPQITEMHVARDYRDNLQNFV
jgi:hypothetical protein